MAQVNVPQKKNEMATIMPIAGGIAGGVIGGVYGKSPQAAMGGAATGAGIGQMAGGLMAPAEAPQGPQATAQQADPATSPNAISRRMEAMNTQPVEQLTAAQTALKYQPPETQKQYTDAINQALILAQRDQRRGQA